MQTVQPFWTLSYEGRSAIPSTLFLAATRKRLLRLSLQSNLALPGNLWITLLLQLSIIALTASLQVGNLLVLGPTRVNRTIVFISPLLPTTLDLIQNRQQLFVSVNVNPFDGNRPMVLLPKVRQRRFGAMVVRQINLPLIRGGTIPLTFPDGLTLVTRYLPARKPPVVPTQTLEPFRWAVLPLILSTPKAAVPPTLGVELLLE